MVFAALLQVVTLSLQAVP